MPIWYAIEATEPDGTVKLWPVADRPVRVSGALAWRYPTWLSTTGDALEFMRRTGWEYTCRAVVTSWSDPLVYEEGDDET